MSGGGSPLLRAVAGFLVEPVEAEPCRRGGRAWSGTGPPVVAVAGLTHGCGVTTVARAAAAELATRDPGGAAIATGASVRAGGIPLGLPAAIRLGRALLRSTTAQVRPVGRLCLLEQTGAGRLAGTVDAARGMAPIVIDVADPGDATLAASLADAVVLVAGAASPPALASVLAGSLRATAPDPVVALNRSGEGEEAWEGRCHIRLPDARLGARLAAGGREPGGSLGRAIAGLVDLLGVD